jgi:hypothetical protein
MPFVLMDFPLMRRERMEELRAIAEQTGVPNVHWSGTVRQE